MRATTKTTAILLAVLLLIGLLAGCAGQQTLTQEDLVLRNADPEGLSELAFGTEIRKNTVASVEFRSSQEGAPAEAADVSETGKGGVLLWAEDREDGLKDLVIAGQGRILAPRDCSYLLSSSEDLRKLGNHFRSLESVRFSDSLDGSQAENLSHLFEGCEKLQTLDLSGFTAEAAVDTSCMFADCKSLQSLDLSSFRVTQVTDTNNMFRYCVKLKDLNLGEFHSDQVQDMHEMFSFCYHLEALDLKSFQTAAVRDMSKMFYQCKNLKDLDVSSFTTEAAENLSNMFASCRSLQKLDLSGFQMAQKVRLKDMFNHCPKSMELITDSEKLQSLFAMQSE